MKNYILLLMFNLVSLSVLADDMQMPAYKNMITSVDYSFDGDRCELKLSCTAQDPIINYAPAMYQDFEEQQMYRFYLPHTTIECCYDDMFGSISSCASGVEVILFGRLADKIVSDYEIVLIIECST